MDYSLIDNIKDYDEEFYLKLEKNQIVDMLDWVIYNKKYGKLETERFSLGIGDKTIFEIDEAVTDIDGNNGTGTRRKHIDTIFRRLQSKERIRIRNNTNVKDNKAFKKENLYDIKLIEEQKNMSRILLSLYPQTGSLPEDDGERMDDNRFLYRSEEDMVLIDESLMAILPIEIQRHMPKVNKLSLFELYFVSVLSNATYGTDVEFLASTKRKPDALEYWIDDVKKEIGNKETLELLRRHCINGCLDFIESKYASKFDLDRLDAIRYIIIPTAQIMLTLDLPSTIKGIDFNHELSMGNKKEIMNYINSVEFKELRKDITKSIIEYDLIEMKKRNHRDTEQRKAYKKSRIIHILNIKDRIMNVYNELSYGDSCIAFMYYYYIKILLEQMHSRVINIFEVLPEVTP